MGLDPGSERLNQRRRTIKFSENARPLQADSHSLNPNKRQAEFRRGRQVRGCPGRPDIERFTQVSAVRQVLGSSPFDSYIVQSECCLQVFQKCHLPP